LGTNAKAEAAQDRVAHLAGEIQLSDEVGLDVFGIGEHGRAEFIDSAPEIFLAVARL